MSIVYNTLLLFLLGGLGWFIFKLLHMPAPAILGSITVIGVLRILDFPLANTPAFFSPFIQILLGVYVGSKINRDTVKELKVLIKPVFIVVVWSLLTVFFLGRLLFSMTSLDLYTSLLSSAMGGLPEMTIIALSTDANIAVIIVMQTARMVSTIALFPYILNFWVKKNDESSNSNTNMIEEDSKEKVSKIVKKEELKTWKLFFWWSFTLAVASLGGYLLLSVGFPAGGMVGGMLFTVVFSLLGFKIQSIPTKAFGVILVGVGIMVSDTITPDTLEIIMSGSLFLPILVMLITVFSTSFLVAFIIHKTTGWDYPTCFLAAAPGGFTVMTALAIKYNKDPFKVSIIHLFRLIGIKVVVPLAFMLFS